MVTICAWILRPTSPVATQAAARKSMQMGDYSKALGLLQQLLEQDGESPALLLKAGEAAARLERFPEAIRYYDRVSDEHPHDAAVARWAAGEVQLQLRKMTPAISMMGRSIELESQQVRARTRLIYLLNLCGRRWETAPHLLELVKQEKFSVQHLIYLGNLAKSIENEKELQEFVRSAPEDAMPLLGLARIRIRAGAFDEAQALLEKTLTSHPDLLEAHVQLGKLLLSTHPERLVAWNQALPKAANMHPDIWMIRAQWARDNSQSTASLRCVGELLQIDPDHLAGLNIASQLLRSLGQAENAQPFLQRSALIEKLLLALEQTMVNEWEAMRHAAGAPLDSIPPRSPKDLEPIVTAAQLTLQLGRKWESVAWSKYGLTIDDSHSQLRALLKEGQTSLSIDTPRTRADALASQIASLLGYELPDWSDRSLSSPVAGDASEPSNQDRMESEARFEELKNPFDFSYFASRTMPTDGRKMFEFTGGGIGILDYDNDGWPDVFLAQGCRWPFDGKDTEHSDRLKRNRGQGASNDSWFEEVTEPARIVESDFGQGVAVGDVNNDGFADIYVCNVGLNRLWINQGDGTFGDGSALFINRRSNWTASAAIADLNGDGQAEVYDANYVEGADVFTRRCNFRGLERACSPLNFQRAKGCLWMPDANGQFVEVGSQVIDSSVQEGNALGLVVFRLRESSLPSIFVANDQVANLILTASPQRDSPLGIRLEDQAVLSGLAYDGDGKAQACMGVAAGDVNADGAIDLIVTNYYDEFNTLYLQLEDGSFRDATRSSGLIAPSLKMLGFGAQLIDTTLSGKLDLVVLNGHVDDLTHAGVPFQMRAQFFSGSGNARFVERVQLSRYFQQPRLGRALARLDFDGDGRQDLVASELEGPTELLRNLSVAGHFINFKLVGTKSHRDAIGAEVIVTMGDKKWTQQVMAGCGYMVTNTKDVHFGVGQATKIDRVEIKWPAGSTQSFQDLAVDTHWLVVEGHDHLESIER